MDKTIPIIFRAVSVRNRSDGWTPRRQHLFVHALAFGFRPEEAAGFVGMGRQSAYALRRRPGAEAFGAAWDEAAARGALRRRKRRLPTLARRALRGYMRPRIYDGRIVGGRQEPDNRRLQGLLARLDGQLAGMPQTASVARFDELLAELGRKPTKRV